VDKKLKVILVGLGSFGKKYFKELHKNKKYDIIEIYRKKVKNKTYNGIPVFYFKNLIQKIPQNIDLAIIVTPVETHFKIAKIFIEKKIPIILEKPAGTNKEEVSQLNFLSIKNKTSVIVNHSETFNINLDQLLKNKKKIGKIKKIICIFGKKSKKYKNKKFLPFVDWFSHPLSVVEKFTKLDFKVLNIKNNIKKIKGSYYQHLSSNLINSKNVSLNILFSNIKKGISRKVLIYGTKGLISYDGVESNQNYFKIFDKKKIIIKNKKIKTISKLLSFVEQKIKNKKYINNLKSAYMIQKIIDKLIKIV